MHDDYRDGGHDRDAHHRDSEHGHERHDECDDHHDHEEGAGQEERNGPQGLQLEMSQVLYSEAEGVAREAFRQLLLEAAKRRWTERFGDKIKALADLAVDQLLGDVLYSLDVEARIQSRNEERADSNEELQAIFGGGSPASPKSNDGGGQTRKAAARRKHRR